jgi:hypothetical protein
VVATNTQDTGGNFVTRKLSFRYENADENGRAAGRHDRNAAIAQWDYCAIAVMATTEYANIKS